jgi:mRNA-degrading endonuclease YafQ of YafQ-DinJ toxin-antitoxin module
MLYSSIDFTKGFSNQFKVLGPKRKGHLYERLDLFKKYPHDKVLCDHALKGKYEGYRSIDIEGNLRVVLHQRRYNSNFRIYRNA